MPTMTGRSFFAAVLLVCSACCVPDGLTALAYAAARDTPPARPVVRAVKPKLDLSGRKRIGRASVYAKKFAGRAMADGTTMHPQSDNAASKTLPLETTAKVTNLETGKSAVVIIRDRGPFVRGRIIDLSSATARKIGLEHAQGVTEVTVAPITIPLPDGGVKLGERSN
jgi:rare lipoprotein A